MVIFIEGWFKTADICKKILIMEAIFYRHEFIWN